VRHTDAASLRDAAIASVLVEIERRLEASGWHDPEARRGRLDAIEAQVSRVLGTASAFDVQKELTAAIRTADESIRMVRVLLEAHREALASWNTFPQEHFEQLVSAWEEHKRVVPTFNGTEVHKRSHREQLALELGEQGPKWWWTETSPTARDLALASLLAGNFPRIDATALRKGMTVAQVIRLETNAFHARRGRRRAPT